MTTEILKHDYSKLPKSVPFFKHYLGDIGMTQLELKEKTMLSRGTITKLVKCGIASNSTIKLVSTILDIDFDMLKKMLITEENQAYYKK